MVSELKVLSFSETDRQRWNSFVAQAPHFALMQSYEWGEFKEKLGWRAFRIAVEQQGKIVAGAQMLIKTVPLGLASVAYIPRGPLGDWLDEPVASLLLSELHRIARRHRAIFLKIEPPLLNDLATRQLLHHYHFQVSPYTNQPRATIILDLTPELDDILARMHQKTRYNIRYAAKKGVTVGIGGSEDLTTFHHLMQITGCRGGFKPRTLDYYTYQWKTFAPLDRIRLFVASYHEKILAINMSAVFGEHAVYLYGASSNEHTNLKPNHLLMWEAIQWAKAQNCRTFDLWGIPDEVELAIQAGHDLSGLNRLDGLWGVYRFKYGFSQNPVFYTSAHDYVYSPLLYTLITNRFFSPDRLERIAVWMDSLRPA